jgi:pimeloyl-ACP methyl ester carboxylesterase
MSRLLPKTLVAAQTADGLGLNGVMIQAEEHLPGPVLVWIHGFGANFYFEPYLRLAEAVAAHRYGVLLANTRGHDFGTLLQPAGHAPYLGGAAWEKLEEAHYDIAAWLDYVEGRGFAGAVLAGHSLGAVKVVAYQAERQDERVRGVVLASPPLRPTWDTRAYPDALAVAQRLAAAGQAETLFAGPWGMVSAQTFLSLDRFGFDQFGRQALSPNLGHIHQPLLAICGAQEEYVITPEDLDLVRANALSAPSVALHVIEGTDHFYSGHEERVATILSQWAETLL